MSLETVNPATGEVIAEYPEMSLPEAFQVLEQVYFAHRRWKAETPEARARKFADLAQVLRTRADDLAQLCTNEMGKLRRSAHAEIEKCASLCEYYAEEGPPLLADQPVSTHWRKSYVAHEPMGLVLAIMPWNYPFWQVIRATIPALLVGNGVVLKHASGVTGCALALEQLFQEAGFGGNLFRTLRLKSAGMSAIIASHRVRAVTFTGSTEVGRKVATQAASAVKKTVLELGGNDPYVVLADADLDLAAAKCAAARMSNAGQSCLACKRIIVVRHVYEDFIKRFVDQMNQFEMGDPNDDATTLAPLAHLTFRDEIHDQVRQSLRVGAKLALGGEIPDRPGAYYPPTVLTDVTETAPAWREELFGPVATIIEASSEEAAIALANNSVYGLGSAIFSKDTDRAERLAREQLDVGNVAINGQFRSDPRIPMGGTKMSGYGREMGWIGPLEFTNLKTILVG